eukprot:CAMPEP_0114614910 /NCGR_PEP_ID=MMETSP0168-20121206/5895_1 /TAXON_ID=95228 ORGANISM="Vannella sp., Strain DIVA3 517/6/12" /NCGR_SAMPLE_ID=MMETSP0168 /ASSEMBLY_ACC=CAM_ASM_000044 /LENGTH=805 /DNA_ID=CAMNT_0001825969 /DNA_START=30 /DNA_END=2443 /DNA_ORIENTATION=+
MNVRRQKYRRVVDAVYTDTGVSTHNIPNLLHYALMTPGKLPKIGKYLEKRAKEGMAKKRLVPVQCSMHIFNELIKACHTDLALFASHVREMMRVLFSSSQLEHKELGTDTFIRFAEHGGMQFELESFVDYFIDMSTAEGGEEQARKRLRTYGLRGLHSYIVMTDDLDNFIAKHLGASRVEAAGSGPNILDIILSNMRFEGPGEPYDLVSLSAQGEEESTAADWEKATIRGLSTWCLKDLAGRVNNITIRPLFQNLLRHLDENNLWVPSDFAFQALKSLSMGLQMSLCHNIIRQLLAHLDQDAIQTQPEVKKSIIKCLIDIMPGNTSAPMIEVLSTMLGQLISTAELDEHMADVDNSNLAKTVIECISTIVQGVTDPLQRLEALNYILSAFRSAQDEAVRSVLAQAILEVSQCIEELPVTKTYPPTLIDRMVECGYSESSVVRVKLQRSLTYVITQSGILQRIRAIAGHAPSGPQKSSRASVLFSNPIENYLEKIREGLLLHAQQDNNQPENFLVVFAAWDLLLTELRGPEVVAMVPLLLELQQKHLSTGTPQAASLQQLVLALFMRMAIVVDSTELLRSATTVLEARADKGCLDAYTTIDPKTGKLSKGKKSKYSSKAKGVELGEGELISKEVVVTHLSGHKGLMAAYGKRLPKMLMSKPSLSSSQAGSEGSNSESQSRIQRRARLVSIAGVAGPDMPTEPKSSKTWEAKSFKKIFDATESPKEPASTSGLPSFASLAASLHSQETKQRQLLENALAFLEAEEACREAANERVEGEKQEEGEEASLADHEPCCGTRSLLQLQFPV